MRLAYRSVLPAFVSAILCVSSISCNSSSDSQPNAPSDKTTAADTASPTPTASDSKSQAEPDEPRDRPSTKGADLAGDPELTDLVGGDQPKTGSDPDPKSPAVDKNETAQRPRETLFEGWPEPQFVLFLTGNQHGYLEPCGCTGLANQRGGMARRHTLLNSLTERGWSVAALDAGDQVRRFGRQVELKLQFTSEALQIMNYQAIAWGPDDLRLPAVELAALTSPFVSCNAAVFDDSFTPPLRIIEAAGKKIGVTSVLGSQHIKALANEDIQRQPPEEGLAKVWPLLEAEQCDLLVLLVQADLDETRQLAGKFPGFDIVVTAGGGGEPTLEPESIEGTEAKLIQVGTKGMYVGVVGFFDDGKMRYQRIPLDDRFADSPQMLQLMAEYQHQLETLGFEGLGIRPVPHPSGRKFVGSERCNECHQQEYDIWKNGREGQGGPHAHATESLVHPGERTDIPRHFDPECLSCHVTGWHPQNYYPYESGYLSLADQLLHGNGCENCHGPGSQHVAAESGEIDATEEVLKQLQLDMRLKYSEAERKCLECHDLDNSPDFHVEGAFPKYWRQIRH